MTTSIIAFYGIAFDTPPTNHKGEQVDVDHFHLSTMGQFEVGLLGYGRMAPNEDRTAIFALSTHTILDAFRIPPSLRLEVDPRWRKQILLFCEALGIRNPPEPCWTITWISW